ncbi:hypothetical protein LNQ81_13930 [Myroides sp. M-43]|uniref:hypothetical protein n=1 Tax=Myroides oncorhynchi TaxID=2893756 RepID=UPI001E43B461|nr:hypothetical protein [Myroides oncorhynchi]MCC9043774.1 hypothetical protein [Myroides oncorhynchi]
MSSYQKHFINIISEQLPEGVKLVDFLSDLVHLSKEACYRRIRCEVEFTLSEVVHISKALNINLTSLVIREAGEKVTCNLRIIKENNVVDGYSKKLEAELNVLEGFESKSKHSLLMVSKELPELLYFGSSGLMKLRLMKLQLNQGVSSPKVFDQIELLPSLKKVQDAYWKAIQQFNIVLYLGPELLTGMLYDIEYFYKTDMLSLENKNVLIAEIAEILDLIRDIGSTGEYKGKKIELYISHLALELSHTCLVSDGLEATVLDLNYPNTLLSFDRTFNQAQTHRLQVIKRTSTLISQSGEIQRTTYLNKHRELLQS